MSQEQPQRPVTYGDVLNVGGPAASQPVTKEDAALMQSSESVVFGGTAKGGVAATLQSAADKNVNAGVEESAETTAPLFGSATADPQQQQRPITYGDVFGPQVGDVATQPVTKEDAALMQSAESVAFGETQKGGAASKMQSAADKNVRSGVVSPDAHSVVAERGVEVRETVTPEGITDTEIVAGQPVTAQTHVVPGFPSATGTKGVTIAEALEVAAVSAGAAPIDIADARAVQSAESRATQEGVTPRGSLASTAMSAATRNLREAEIGKATLSDVLTDAKEKIASDKLVTREDASRVVRTEMRNREGATRPGGVAETIQEAADFNELSGFVTPSTNLPPGRFADTAVAATRPEDELAKQMESMQVPLGP